MSHGTHPEDLLVEVLDDVDPGHGGLDDSGEFSGAMRVVPEARGQHLSATFGHEEQERKDHQSDSSERKREPQHNHQRDDEGENIAGDLPELQSTLHRGHVRDRPAYHLAGPQLVLLRSVEPLKRFEDVDPQSVFDTEVNPANVVAPEHARQEP